MATPGKHFVLKTAAAIAALLPAPALADTRAGVVAWNAGDYPSAVREWRASAAEEDSDAHFNLGQAYRYGRGVPQDLVRAEYHYAKAAAKGHAQAEDIYGVLLFQRGAEAEAMPYLRAAARRSDAAARYFLALAHFNGDVAERDYPLAYALASLADVSGLPQARRALESMDRYLSAEQKSQALALAQQIGEAAEVPAVNSRLTVAAPRTAPRKAAPTVACAPKQRPQSAPAETLPAAPRSSGPWKVQLGAFGVPGNVGRMWQRVAGLPEIAGHERIETRAGQLTVLKAGGYASQAAARQACNALKQRGHDCLVTR